MVVELQKCAPLVQVGISLATLRAATAVRLNQFIWPRGDTLVGWTQTGTCPGEWPTHLGLGFVNHLCAHSHTGPGLHNPKPNFFGVVTFHPGEKREAPKPHETVKIPETPFPRSNDFPGELPGCCTERSCLPAVQPPPSHPCYCK